MGIEMRNGFPGADGGGGQDLGIGRRAAQGPAHQLPGRWLQQEPADQQHAVGAAHLGQAGDLAAAGQYLPGRQAAEAGPVHRRALRSAHGTQRLGAKACASTPPCCSTPAMVSPSQR